MPATAPPADSAAPLDSALLRALLAMLLAGVIAWIVATHALTTPPPSIETETARQGPVVDRDAPLFEGPIIARWAREPSA